MLTDPNGGVAMWGVCETPGCGGEFETGGRGRPRKYCDDCKACRASRDTSSVWRVDLDAVDAARLHMGISLPVYVRRTRGKRLQGRYHGIVDAGMVARSARDRFGHEAHYVTVSASLHPTKASRTIYHELAHARQRERDETSAQGAYVKARDGLASAFAGSSLADAGTMAHLAYLATPQEVEARMCEGLHDEIGPVTTWTTQTTPRQAYNDADALERVRLARRAWELYADQAIDAMLADDWGIVWDVVGESLADLLALAKATREVEQ
jgi:hypothetical protein